MLSTSDARELLTDLIEAWKSVGSVLTGKRVDLHESLDVSYPDLRFTSEQLATYAWSGEWLHGQERLEEALHELSSATELAKATFFLPDGTELFGLERKEMLMRLSHACNGRWALDNDQAITIELLAALAGVSEKTVRAATNPKAPNPIAITKDGHWTLIEADAALAWLSRRPGFCRTRWTAADSKESIPADLPALIDICTTWLLRANLTAEALLGQSGWSELQVSALQRLLAGQMEGAFPHLGPASLRQFGTVVGMTEPDEFARRAYHLLAVAYADALTSAELGGST